MNPKRCGKIALYREPLPPAVAGSYSVPQAAALLGVGASTVRDAIKQGRFPFPTVQILGRVTVAKAPLDAHLRGRAA